MSLNGPAERIGSVQRSVSKVTLGRQIQQALRLDILFGRYQPGDPLRQVEICERFQVSRIPVRDALQGLINEGLVVRAATDRIQVASLTSDGLTDMFHIEATLHAYAAKCAAERGNKTQLAEIASLGEQMREAEHEGQSSVMADLNFRFHRSINLAAGSQKIIASLAAVSVNIHREFLIEVPEWAEHSNDQHDAIVSALLDRNGKLVEELMYRHVKESGDKITTLIFAARKDATSIR